MFVAIFVAIVIAAGLGYYLMKKSKSTEVSANDGPVGLAKSDVAKSDVEAKLLAFLEATKNDILTGTSTAPPYYDAFVLRLNEVHQEFGVTLLPPEELTGGHENPATMDLESLTHTWIACAKNMKMSTCWQSAA